MSFRSMAAVLGITEETARWRVFKARQKLLQTLSPELFPASFSAEGKTVREGGELEGSS